jgi:hypothetical protein
MFEHVEIHEIEKRTCIPETKENAYIRHLERREKEMTKQAQCGQNQ